MSDPKFVTRELRATPGVRALPWERRASNRIRSIEADVPGGYHWRETEELFRSLSAGNPDHLGRRLFTDAARADSLYVARVAWKAYRRKDVPASKIVWGHLRASIRRVFQELEEFASPSARRSL